MEPAARPNSPAWMPFRFGALGVKRATGPVTQRVAAIADAYAASHGRFAVGGRLGLALWSRDAELAERAQREQVELLAPRRAAVHGSERIAVDVLVESPALADTALWWETAGAADWETFVGTTTCFETVRALRHHALRHLEQVVDVSIGGTGPFRLRLLRPAGIALAAIARFGEAPTFAGMRDAEWAAAMELLVTLLERQGDAMFSDVWSMQEKYLVHEAVELRDAGRHRAVELVIEFLDHGQYDDALDALHARSESADPLPFHPDRLAPVLTWCEQAALALNPDLA